MSTPVPAPWVTSVLILAWVALGIVGIVAAPHALAAVGVIALGMVLPWFRFNRTRLRRLQLAVVCGFASLAVAIGMFYIAELPLCCP